MSHRFAALSFVLGAILVAASLIAMWVGVTDTMVTLAGPKRHLDATALPAKPIGWFAIDGCVRHDQAVVVAGDGTVYRLGEPGPDADDGDRIYTPLAARNDCDESKPPSHVYALLEDQEATSMTLGKFTRQVAPPSIPAIVDGIIGPRVGDKKRAEKAKAKLGTGLPGLSDAPLLRKGVRPGELWVGLFTCGASLHGLLLLALGFRYLRRRSARREALRTGQIDEEEEVFFRTETLD